MVHAVVMYCLLVAACFIDMAYHTQDELSPLEMKFKAKVDPECLTDALAARSFANELLTGMDKPHAETMQAHWG